MQWIWRAAGAAGSCCSDGSGRKISRLRIGITDTTSARSYTMRAITPRSTAIAAAVTALAICACGSNEPRPTEELTRARVLIDQADKAGARQYASADLQAARDKLRRADSIVEQDTKAARRLAVQASLDAELAAARTRSGKAESAAEEIAASVSTLRDEAARGGGSSMAPRQQQPSQQSQQPQPQQQPPPRQPQEQQP
jgi:hypothetical protein